MPQLCLAGVRIIVQLGKERTAEGLKHCANTGCKLCVCMGHGVNSEGNERGIGGTRDNIAVEREGRRDRNGK